MISFSLILLLPYSVVWKFFFYQPWNFGMLTAESLPFRIPKFSLGAPAQPEMHNFILNITT